MALCQYCGKKMGGFWAEGTYCSFRCVLYNRWYFFMIFAILFLFMGLLFDIGVVLLGVMPLFGEEVLVNDRVPTTLEFFLSLGYFSILGIVLTLFGVLTVRMTIKAKKDKKKFKKGYRRNIKDE